MEEEAMKIPETATCSKWGHRVSIQKELDNFQVNRAIEVASQELIEQCRQARDYLLPCQIDGVCLEEAGP
eukprot:4764966-Amphidinium_carterae.2